MPSIYIVYTQVTEQRADGRMSHKELPETGQTIACTDANDAASKLQTVLTPLVGAGAAATHATLFTTRQGLTARPTKHVGTTTPGKGVSAIYQP